LVCGAFSGELEREVLSKNPMTRKRGKVNGLSRREFIRLAAAAATAAGATGCGGTGTPWRVLSVEEARTLAAVVDQLIPPDQDPGAAWAGVVNYIDLQLAGHYRKHWETYRKGIAGVDETSRALAGNKFVDVPDEKQIAVLKALESGHAPGNTWNRLPPRQFFTLVLTHTMQGFYGDPRHGGNREGVGWKMLGLAYPPIRGRIRYDLVKDSGNPSETPLNQ
jgi:gluconate 2-dehydrogenase gamma chain